MTPQRLLRLRIDAQQALQTGAGVNAHRVLELLAAYELIRDREEILMWDLTITQLEKIHEALCLLGAEGKSGNGDLSAIKLADQISIIIAARKREAVDIVATTQQGLMHVKLQGR